MKYNCCHFLQNLVSDYQHSYVLGKDVFYLVTSMGQRKKIQSPHKESIVMKIGLLSGAKWQKIGKLTFLVTFIVLLMTAQIQITFC